MGKNSLTIKLTIFEPVLEPDFCSPSIRRYVLYIKGFFRSI